MASTTFAEPSKHNLQLALQLRDWLGNGSGTFVVHYQPLLSD